MACLPCLRAAPVHHEEVVPVHHEEVAAPAPDADDPVGVGPWPYELQPTDCEMHKYTWGTDSWTCSCSAEWEARPLISGDVCLQRFAVTNVGAVVSCEDYWGNEYICKGCKAVWRLLN